MYSSWRTWRLEDSWHPASVTNGPGKRFPLFRVWEMGALSPPGPRSPARGFPGTPLQVAGLREAGHSLLQGQLIYEDLAQHFHREVKTN